VRAAPTRTFGAVQPPRAKRQRERGEGAESNPAKTDVHEREVRGDDPDEEEAAEIGEPAPDGEQAPRASDAEQWEHAEPGEEHQDIRANERGHPHGNR
jgi:hypothetical protein